MSIVYPYSDFFVRYLLGDQENIDLLLSFINAVHESSGFELIKSVIIKNPFNLKEHQYGKESILDIKAVDEKDVHYNIEIQVTGNELYANRSLYYWAKSYSSQLKQGEEYNLLNPVACINLINFTLIKDNNDIHSCFLLKEKNKNELILSDHFAIHFLELPKFVKTKNFRSSLEHWLAFFKYEGQEEDIMKYVIKSNPHIAKAHDKYTAFTMNDEAMEKYEAHLKWKSQYKTDLAYAKQEGKVEGKAEGKAEVQIENALAMKKDGVPIDKISRYTSLSIEEIEAL